MFLDHIVPIRNLIDVWVQYQVVPGALQEEPSEFFCILDPGGPGHGGLFHDTHPTWKSGPFRSVVKREPSVDFSTTMAETSTPSVVNVSDLVARPGSQRRVHVSGPGGFGVELSRLAPGRRVDAELLFESLLEGVLVTGEVSFVMRHTCNRCLREWEERGLVPVIQLYGPEPDEDGYRLEPGDLIDLEQLFRDEITLSFPLAPVCRSECRGLCPTCGIDLNEAPRHQHEEEPDSPFAVLGQLFEHEEK
jgi:uncharacterized protein